MSCKTSTTLSASQCHSSPYITRLARHTQPVSVTAALTSLVLHNTLSQSVSQQPLRHSSCTTHSASQCHSSPYVTCLARHSQPVSVTTALTSLVLHDSQPVSVTAALTSLVLHDTLSQSVSQQPLRHSSCTTLSQSVSQQPLRHSSCTTLSASQCHSSPYVTRLARHSQPVSVTAALTSLVLHDTLSQSVSQQPLRHSSCTTLSASQCHSSPYVTRLARHSQPVSVTAALTSLVLHDTLSQSVSQQPLRHSSCTTHSASQCHSSPYVTQSQCHTALTSLARHSQPVSVTTALTSLVLHDTLSQSVSQQPLRHSSCTTLSASQCHSSPYVTRLARHPQPVSVTAALTSLVLHDTLSQSVSQQPLRHSSLSASQSHSSPYVTRLARHSQPVSLTAALTSLVLHDTLSQSVSQQPLRHSSCTTLSASQCHSSPYVTRLARHSQPVSVTAALTSLVLHDTLSQSVSQQPLRHSSCTTLSASQCHSSPYVTRLARHTQPVSVTAALTSLVLHDTLTVSALTSLVTHSASQSQQPLRHSSCTTHSASQCHSSPYVTRLAADTDTLSQSVSQQPLRHSSCTTLSASQCHSSPYVTRLARHTQPVSVTTALTSLVLHDTLSQSVSQQPLRHSSCTTLSASQCGMQDECHSSPYVTRLARHSQPVSVTAALTSLVLHDTLSQSVSQQPLRHSSCTTLSASQCHSSPYVTRLARHSQPVSVTAALTSLVLHDTLSQSVSQQPLRHSSCTTFSASQCHSSPYVTRLARHTQPVSVTAALTSLVLHDTLSQSVSQQPLRHSSCTTLSASQCHSSPYVTRLARHSQPVSVTAALTSLVLHYTQPVSVTTALTSLVLHDTQPVSVTAALTSLVLHDTLSQSVSQQPLRHSSCTTHSASQCHSSPYVTRLARHSQPVSVTAALTSLVLHDTLSQSVSQQPLRHSSCTTHSASQCHSSPYVTRLARHTQPVSVTAALTSLVLHDTLSQSVSQQPLRHSSCTTLSASQCHSSPYVTRLARHTQPVSVTAALTSLVLHDTLSQSVSQQPLRHSSCTTHSASQCHSSPYVTRLA